MTGLAERLREALRRGEGETVEFRRSFGAQVLRTLCAFANTLGGELWVGVADDGTVVGTSVGRESLRDWPHHIRQELGINAKVEAGKVEAKPVVRIAVEESWLKPVRYGGRGYVRSGSSDRIATEEEETRWVLGRTGQTWDALPEPRARWDNLDPERIRWFRQGCNRRGARTVPDDEDDPTVLRVVGLPEPEWREEQGALWVTFRRDILTEEYLRSLGLNDRQVRAILYVKDKGRITNGEYRQLFQVSKRTASDELSQLETKGLLERVGTTGRGRITA